LIELEFESSAEFTNLGHAFIRPKSEGINMKILSGPQRRRSEAGVALLIAIFVLMLISVTAIALIISSGTETALAGNYRSSASTYYAALAGLEEARGRLLPSNPDYFGTILPPPGGLQLPLGNVLYIQNPLPGETVNPADLSNASTYPDKEYDKEYGSGALASATVQSTASVSTTGGIPGPLYKWVRINAVTEASLKVDVNGDSNFDANTPLYFDPAHIDTTTGNPKPSLIVTTAPPSSAVQALEITALAALPNGSQKLLQYIVAPSTPNLNFAGAGSPNPSFPAALTLIGNNVSFTGPNSAQFQVNGNDQCGATSAVYGIGYTNGIVSNPNKGSYSGAGNLSPNIVNLNGVPPNLQTQTPSGLDALVQTITQNADAVLTGPADERSLPAGMSAGSPATVVVNGNFDLGSHFTGYGVLVVTGIFSYDSDSSWKGVILVIGQGTVIANHLGNVDGEIDGAILVAQTRDSSGNLLPDPNLGSASFKSDLNGGGLGIYYSSCWLKAAQRPLTFKVLSYHQLSQ
jgi:hypothetical protein